MNLEKKIIIITGGTSGIGFAAAKLFLKQQNTCVLLLGSSNTRGEAALSELKKKSSFVEFYQCDVSRRDEIDKFYEYVKMKYNKVDVLINSAGISILENLDELKYEDWDRSFAVNVDGTMFMCKTFMKLLKESKGVIINISSISGLDSYTSGTRQYIYASTKAAVIKISKLLALNYAPDIRVNCVCPGVIKTDIWINKDFSRFLKSIPLGRVAEAEEIADVIMFITNCTFMTGSVITVDGGQSLL